MNTVKRLLPSTLLFLPVRPIIMFLLMSGLLSGCQHFPSLFPDDAKVLNPSVSEQVSVVDKHEFTLARDQALFGSLATITVKDNDTLPDIARHFGLGYNDISMANPSIAAWTPTPGSQVLLPLQFILPDSPRKGITLNLANMRLFYYPKQTPDKVFTYPVGIGRDGWNTPTGLLKIISKTANPSWNVPESIQREHARKGDALPAVVRAGPNNPLGNYAMRLTVSHYLIHGTNKPYGIGMQVSHGCVQLYPENIETLFEKITIGTPVQIVHQPYLTAWHEGMLYLEANKPLQNHKQSKMQLMKQLRQLSSKKHATIDWKKVERVLDRADGVPTPILENSPDIAEITRNALPLKHPDYFNHQPVIEAIKADDWAIRVADFKDETKAQQLVTMLNHQGPIIPARKVAKDHAFQVIAGPFKNKTEVLAVAKRIRMDFELKAEPLKPGQILVN